MYLREMGSVELLSREGEIAIAKRIEAGRDMMIGGICESPITFRAHRRLARPPDRRRQMLLRDIIDLDATYGATPMARSHARLDAAEWRAATPVAAPDLPQRRAVIKGKPDAGAKPAGEEAKTDKAEGERISKGSTI